jgi:hypothetical protein
MAEPQTTPRPPIPVLSLNSIYARRDNLSSALTQFLGRTMVGADFQAFVDALHNKLTVSSVPVLREVVKNSVKDVLKKNLTEDLLRNVCWRIAGNLSKLRAQEPAPEWTIQWETEWVIAQISSVYTVGRGRKVSHNLTFEIQSGSPTLQKINQKWSAKKIKYLAKHRNDKQLGFGFGRSRTNSKGEQLGTLLLQDVRQFYGLRCWLLIDAALSTEEPFAVEVGHTSSTMGYNRDLLKLRDRSHTACSKGLPSSQECHMCPYGRDKCKAATHAQSYVLKQCKLCEAKQFFDKEDLEFPEYCVNCAYGIRKK